MDTLWDSCQLDSLWMVPSSAPSIQQVLNQRAPFPPALSCQCERQWSMGPYGEGQRPTAARTRPLRPQDTLSPTRAGQETRFFQQEFLCGEEGLLCHEQRVLGLGHTLRRQEAGLRGHGWQKALRGGLRCAERRGDAYLGEAAGAGGQLHGFQDAAGESGECEASHVPRFV